MDVYIDNDKILQNNSHITLDMIGKKPMVFVPVNSFLYHWLSRVV